MNTACSAVRPEVVCLWEFPVSKINQSNGRRILSEMISQMCRLRNFRVRQPVEMVGRARLRPAVAGILRRDAFFPSRRRVTINTLHRQPNPPLQEDDPRQPPARRAHAGKVR
jgi:hypothetical protein